MSKFQIQVNGQWGGESGGWRPAVYDERGVPSWELSTFEKQTNAERMLSLVTTHRLLSKVEGRFEFRVVAVRVEDVIPSKLQKKTRKKAKGKKA